MRVARGDERRGVFGLARRPDEQRRAGFRVAEVEQALGHARIADRAGVGEKDDRRLETLGGVHGHDAHAVAPRLHVALHRRVVGLDLVEEGGERGRLLALVGERQRHDFVDRVARFGAETLEQRAPPAVGAEQRSVEGERRAFARALHATSRAARARRRSAVRSPRRARRSASRRGPARSRAGRRRRDRSAAT